MQTTPERATGGEPKTARQLLVRYFEDVLNKRNPKLVREIFDPHVVYHSPGSPAIRGLPDLERWVTGFLDGVPDYRANLEDTLGDGDKAALRWSCTGTHKGPMLGMPPTGRRFRFSGMTIFRVKDGRVVEGWIERDSLGLFRQLNGTDAP